MNWASPVKGAIYADAIDRAKTEGKVSIFPVDPNVLVDTAWDLGAPRNTVVWYFQVVGREIRIVDCDRVRFESDEAKETGFQGTLTERVAMMLGKGYTYGKHFVPHDSEQTERTSLTVVGELRKLLPPSSVITVPRTHSVWVGINHALEMFPTLAFRSPQCDDGLHSLACYRTRRENEGAAISEEPVHDFASHAADAFRTMAEVHRAGLLQFKHVTATPKPDWWKPAFKEKRRGLKPMRVSAGF
jgi:hypothetical protein